MAIARSAPDAGASTAFPWVASSILFFSHFVVDSHASFLAPLLPLLREKLGFSLAAAGFLISLLSVSGALSQPVTALVVDRWPRMPWLPLGLVGSSLAFTAMGWAPSYEGVAVAICLGGISFGLCHPDMAARAGRLSQRYSSLTVSMFVTGGRIGFALGPLVAIAIAEAWGMEWLWTYVVVATIAAAGVTWGLPAAPETRKKEKGEQPAEGVWQALVRVRGPITLLFLVAVVRAIVLANLGGFLPTLFVEKGEGLWLGGMANTVIFTSGAVGVMIGGVLGDRLGKRNVIAVGIGVGLVGHVLFLALPLQLSFGFLAVVGIGVFIPMGVSTALAQDLMPEHRGFASSLTLGGGWFLASLSSVPIAWAGERIGLLQALWVLPLVLALGVLIALALPSERKLAEV